MCLIIKIGKDHPNGYDIHDEDDIKVIRQVLASLALAEEDLSFKSRKKIADVVREMEDNRLGHR